MVLPPHAANSLLPSGNWPRCCLTSFWGSTSKSVLTCCAFFLDKFLGDKFQCTDGCHRCRLRMVSGTWGKVSTALNHCCFSRTKQSAENVCIHEWCLRIVCDWCLRPDVCLTCCEEKLCTRQWIDGFCDRWDISITAWSVTYSEPKQHKVCVAVDQITGTWRLNPCGNPKPDAGAPTIFFAAASSLAPSLPAHAVGPKIPSNGWFPVFSATFWGGVAWGRYNLTKWYPLCLATTDYQFVMFRNSQIQQSRSWEAQNKRI